MSKSIYFITLADFKAKSAVHENVDEKLIYPEIKVAQDLEILPFIGSGLYERLQTGIKDNDLNDDEKKLLNDYIIDVLVWFAMTTIPLTTSYQQFTKGVVRQQSENSSLPDMGDIRELVQTYRKRGEYYRERLIKYLERNKAKFPQYGNDSCSDDGAEGDLKPSKSGYTVPCYLPE